VQCSAVQCSAVSDEGRAGIAKYFSRREIFKRICAPVTPASRASSRREESENNAGKVPVQSSKSIQTFLTYPPVTENIGSNPKIHLTLWPDSHHFDCIWPFPTYTALIVDINYTVKNYKLQNLFIEQVAAIITGPALSIIWPNLSNMLHSQDGYSPVYLPHFLHGSGPVYLPQVCP
jgi:hypothetical protein